MGDDAVFAPEVERSVYFVAAELLTNIAKHSGARSASMQLDASTGTAVDGSAATAAAGTDAAAAVAGMPELVLQVRDTGVGGAAASDGHGLAGLAERLHGLRGQLEVDSPVGGPTTVTARVPLASL